MKNLFIFFAVCISYLSYSQQYLHQVLILNEGYFDFSLNQTVVPPTIGSYDHFRSIYNSRHQPIPDLLLI